MMVLRAAIPNLPYVIVPQLLLVSTWPMHALFSHHNVWMSMCCSSSLACRYEFKMAVEELDVDSKEMRMSAPENRLKNSLTD